MNLTPALNWTQGTGGIRQMLTALETLWERQKQIIAIQMRSPIYNLHFCFQLASVSDYAAISLCIHDLFYSLGNSRECHVH